MTAITFYPLGNADCTFIQLADNRLILKDCFFCEPEGPDDRRVDLAAELRRDLAAKDRSDFDVCAFSHADNDHTQGAETFFWFEHAKKYQGDDRIKFAELWVPACFITEVGCEGSAQIIQAEARHRLIQGSGIRVFGNPDSLKDWLRLNKVDPLTRLHLITDAGACVPGFDREHGQAEIFSHSPFCFRLDGDTVDRNGNSLVWQITFFENGSELYFILGADATHDVWANIVTVTLKHGNDQRLKWGLLRVSHHSSYLSLSEEKGEEETQPRSEVYYLFDQAEENCLVISSSKIIPNADTDQPPHRQAANFYRRIAHENGAVRNFVVTMEHPTALRPRPIVVDATANGFVLQKRSEALGSIQTVTSHPSPRFG